MNRYLAIDKIRALLLEDNFSDEEEIEGKEDDGGKNIIHKNDYDTDLKIEINEEDERSTLDVKYESFEDHDNDDQCFMEARSIIKKPSRCYSRLFGQIL